MTHNLRLLLFGNLRKYCPKGTVELEVQAGAGVPAIKRELGRKLHELDPQFSSTKLLDSCAIGNQDSLLDDRFQVTEDVELAVLPPVCGG